MDATAAQTDVNSFAVLEPRAEALRNDYTEESRIAPVPALIEPASRLTLTVPEMSVLLAGMRVLGANAGGESTGLLTNRPGALTNDFFVMTGSEIQKSGSGNLRAHQDQLRALPGPFSGRRDG